MMVKEVRRRSETNTQATQFSTQAIVTSCYSQDMSQMINNHYFMIVSNIRLLSMRKHSSQLDLQ